MNMSRGFAVLFAALGLAVGTPLFVAAAQKPVTVTEPSGERWYRGDGLGYTITLILGEDGTYDARWSGCLGEYGSSKGVWVDQGSEISLAAEHEAGMMQGHLRSLRKLTVRGTDVLVPPEDIAAVVSAQDEWIHLAAFTKAAELGF
jgi:hypothetical protein